MRSRFSILSQVIALIVIVVPWLLAFEHVSAGTCGGATPCNCGDTLVQSQTMWYDITDCVGQEYGLVIGSDSITLDAAGHTIDGDWGECGILIKNRDSVVVKNCNVIEFWNTFFIDSSSYCEVTANTGDLNGYGIALYSNCTYNLLSDNTMTNNNGEGINLHQSCNYNRLVGNRLINNMFTGIVLGQNCDNNVVSGNIVKDNQDGAIRLGSSCSGNLIYNNYFRDGAEDLGTNFWDTTKTLGTNIVGGPYIGGNYWCGYRGQDLDGDGIGDTDLPHNGDTLPLVLLEGDSNSDGTVNVGDVVFLVNYLYRNGDPPDLFERADANCDNEITVGDVVRLVNYLFRGGSAPCCT